MADAQANININLNTSDALAQLKILQRQISQFHQSMSIGGAKARAESAQLAQTLINNVNASGKFSASIQRTLSTTESFTNALEKNKLSMGEYFRYGMGASKSFSRFFASEFATINKVARERVKTLQTQYIQLGRDANGAMQSIAVRPLMLDMKNLGTQVMMTSQRQQIFNQLLKQGSTNLLNFGKNTQWAGRQLMVGFTVPLTIMGGIAIQEFQKMEEQAVKFRRVYGDMFTTEADTEKALQNVRELADEFTKYGIAVEKTIGLAAKVAQMGNVGADLTAQVTQATRLAVLGGLEQEEALETTISLTNAFGIAAEDLAGKIAFLNAAENQTVLAIEDFNEAIPKAGSVVQQLGGDVEDLAFMLTAMREGGINASQAANAIKSSLGRMINPTEAAKQRLSEFGIDIMGIVENNAGDLRSTIMQLGYSLDALDPLQRARAIETLFGKFQFARMSTMFQNIVKDGSQASRILELTTNSTEELAIIAERELKRVEESPIFKLQKQMEQLQAALAPIGEEFIKVVTPIVEGATKILKWFNGLGDGAKQFAVIAVAAIGVIAPTFLMLFGLVANGFANLIKGISKVGSFLGLLSGQSQMVGGSFNYMTQEQIEAQAVSASLEQTHQRLYQAFTSEKVALDALIASYQRATSQISSLNAASSAGAAAAGAAGATRYNPFVPPKKYADGVLMVPGPKGAGDIIPAMLSPGEAVIPAKETKKYLPLIQGIINDSLPGFAEGTDGFGNVSAASFDVAKSVTGREAPKTAITNLMETLITRRMKELGETLEDASNTIRTTFSTLDDEAKKTVQGIRSSQQYVENREETYAGKKQQAHFGSGQTVSATQASAVMPGSAPLAAVSKLEQVTGKAYGFSEKHSWTKLMSGLSNREMGIQATAIPAMVESGKTVGRSAEKLVGEFAGQSLEERATSYGEAVSAAGGDIADPETKSILIAYDQKIQALLQSRLDENADLIVLDTQEQINALPEDMRSNYVAMEAIEQQAAKDVLGGNKIGALRDTALQVPREWRVPKAVSSEIGRDAELAYRQGKIGKEEFSSIQANIVKKPSPQFMAGAKDKKRAVDQVKSEAVAAAEEVGGAAGDGVVDGTASSLQIASPSKRMFNLGKNAGDSLASGFEQSAAGPQGSRKDPFAPPPPPAGKPLGIGAPPPPPIVPDVAPSRMGRFKSGARNVAEKGLDVFSRTTPGKKMAQFFADTSGADIVNSKGEIIATARSLEELKGEVSDLGNAAEKTSQQVGETGQDIKSDIARDESGNPIIGSDGKPLTNKQIKKEAARQKRQARAGRALVGLGAVTGGLAAATQLNVDAPVIGNVGEFAQKLLPVTGALTAIAPILMALPGPIALVVAVFGGLAAITMSVISNLKKVKQEAFDLTKALGVGKDAVQIFAEFAGKASSSEIMDRRREESLTPYSIQPGETPFGTTFLESESGQNLLNNIQSVIASSGMQKAQDDLSRQLQAALIDGSLTIEQARGIALALGQELEDYGFTMKINAELDQIFGPSGENLLEGGLTIPIQFMQETGAEIDAARSELFSSFEAQTFSNYGASTFEGMTEEIDKVGPWLDQNVPRWFRTLSPIVEIGAYITAAVKGAWTGGLKPAEDYAKAVGTYIGELSDGFESYQMVIDSTAARYDRLIADAEAEGNFDEASSLREQKLQAEIDLLEEYQNQINNVITSFEESGQDFQIAQLDELDAQLRLKFEDDPEQQQIMDNALSQIKDLQLNPTTEFILKTQVLADNISLSNLDYLSGLEDNEVITQAVNISTNLSGKEADLAIMIGKMFGQDEAGLESQREFYFNLSMEDPEEAKEALNVMNQAAQLTGLVGEDAEIFMNAVLNLEGAAQEDLESDINYLDSLDGKEINISIIEEHIGADVATIIRGNQEYFDSLPDDQKLTYTYVIRTMMTAVGDPAFMGMVRAWGSASGKLPFNATPEQVFAVVPEYLNQMADWATKTGAVAGMGDGEDGEGLGGGGGGGGPSGSILDPIVKASRDFGNIGQEITTGWEASLDAILNMVDGVAWATNGLSNQLRRIDVPETLIEKFLGMDPEEWEKAKKDLFVVDETNTPVELNEKGKKVVEAASQATIAEEIDSVESQIATTEDQIAAFDRLVASGADVALAYDIIQNKALATAIATAKTTEQVKRLIEVNRELRELEEELEEINEEEQRKQRISDAVEEMNRKFNDQVKALNKIRAAADKYTDAQIRAIFENQDLMSLFLEPSINPGALKKALDNAEKQAQLELDIKLLTFQGREDWANEAFSNVKDKFAAEQTRIELEFDLEIAGQEDIIDQAEKEIAALSYMIDDYQAGLTEIQNQEEVINEAYEKRFEALDKVANINEKIAQQQQNQLDLAEALSRGDIAAAAQAAQRMREQEAKDSIEEQRELLEQRQKAEIDSLRSASGLTRKELEDQLKFLEDKIFQIEEQRLEPAQEYIRLAEIRRDREIDSLTVLGRTTAEWDRMQNAIDVARTRNYQFMDDLEKQFAMYPSILAKYLEDRPLPAPPPLPPPPPPARRRSARLSSAQKRENYRAWESHVAQVKNRQQNPGTFRYPNRVTADGRVKTGEGRGYAFGGLVERMAMGGMVKGGMFRKLAMGGIVPSYFANGGMSMGSDLIPAMLTPGEFVIRRPAVNEFGAENLEKINRGTYNGGSMYNYNLEVNVRSDANPEQIANTVMREIRRIDSKRIRDNRL